MLDDGENTHIVVLQCRFIPIYRISLNSFKCREIYIAAMRDTAKICVKQAIFIVLLRSHKNKTL